MGTGRPWFRLRLIDGLVSATVLALVVIYVVVPALQFRRLEANREVVATTEITTLSQALADYVEDESELPASDLEPDPQRNDFPVLFDALFAERRPRDKGGRGAPYASFRADKIAVALPGGEGYRNATPTEISDPEVKKYLFDPWRNPYVYRAGKTILDAKIYSLGPDGEDNTRILSQENDDIGNW